MRVNRLVPSFALAILIALGSGLVGPNLAQAAGKPTPTPPATGITFGVQPATKGVPDARPNYRYAVTPAGVMVDQVGVRNLSTTPITVRVYATDALNINNGGFGLLPRAQRPRDVGTWITVGGLARDGTVTVGPRSVKVLTLSLKVPVKAQPGDHTGGIIASVTTLSKDKKTGTATNVELDQRVAVRLFVRVSGPLRPSLSIKPLDANYQNILNPIGRGATNVTYRITNTGNVNMGGRQSLSIKGLVGPAQVLKVTDAEMLLPGGYVDVKTSLKQTWPLVHESAKVTVKPLVLVGDLGVGKATYSAATSFWAIPWTLLALLVLVGFGLWFRRRVRRKRQVGVVGAHRSGTGDKTEVSETRAGETGASEVGINQRRAARLVASTSLALAAMIATSGAATAAVVLPYTDANATGGITLCNAHGQPVTSGSIDTALATTVVGGTAAVPPYDGTGRTAMLVAYQPRRGVEPGLWSGQGLTANSRYTNPANPMVEILPRDYSIRDFVTAYHAQWDGLVQLRIHLRVPNQPTKNDTYAATTLKVAGSTWQQVGASAGAPCNVGRATSVIRLLGLPITKTTAKATGKAGTPTGSAATPPTSSSSTSPSRATASGTTPPSTVAPEALAKASSSLAPAAKGDGTNPLIWAVSATVLLAFVLSLLWLARRRRARPSLD